MRDYTQELVRIRNKEIETERKLRMKAEKTLSRLETDSGADQHLKVSKFSAAICGICEMEYAEAKGRVPRIIECGHTMCEECIEYLNDSTTITCPLDFKTMTVVETSQLPKNFALLELIRENLEWVVEVGDGEDLEELETVEDESSQREEEREDDGDYLDHENYRNFNDTN